MAPRVFGFVGLGNMGIGLASRIQQYIVKDGDQLLVWNRTASKADPVVKLGATFASLEEIGSKCEIIFSCLGSEESLKESTSIVLGAKPASHNILFVDTSTITPECVMSLHEAFKAKGSVFLNNPVWGPPEAAAQGTLVWILSGPSEAKAIVAPFLQGILARKVIDAGESADDGAKLKICGNCTLLPCIEVLAEAMQLADLLGVKKYSEFLDTFFQGTPLQYYGKRMLSGGYEIDPEKKEVAQVAVSLGSKDLKFGSYLAKKNNGAMPAADLTVDHMQQTAEKYGGHHDITAIYGLIREKAGLPFSKKNNA